MAKGRPPEEPHYRVAISDDSYERMIDLVRRHQVPVLDHGSRKQEDGRYRADAILTAADIERLEAAGYQVDRFEDVHATGRARQQEVGSEETYVRRPR